MDDSVGSSSSSSLSPPSHHPTQPPTPEYPAHLANLHVTIPCRTPSDALLSSLSVALAEDLSSTVIDAFLQLFHDPAFRSAEVTFRSAQDIARHISEQRKRIAQKRSLGVPIRSRYGYGSPSSIDIENENENETRNTDIVYGRIPQLIVDMVAQQLSSETETFSHQVDWDTTICNFRENRTAREQDLLNMSLVHRTWTYPAMRALRSRVKIVGSRSLQSFLRSPRMGSWIRELYFIESLENENAREMMRLLEYTLRHTPNLRQLAIRTWWRIGTSNQHDLDGVIRELGNMKELQALWLFTNRGHIGCLPTLVATLPDLKSLRKLYLRNWMVGSGDEGSVNASLRELTNSSTSGARLTTLSFVDGALSETSGIFLPWLLHHSPLTNLEIHTKDLFWVESNGPSPMFTALLPFLPSLKTLRLHYSSLNGNTACRTEFIKSCSNVRNFSMVVGLHHELDEFPEGVENVHVHFSTIWPVSGRRLAEVVGPQRLEKLKRVVLTKDPVDAFMFEGGFGENVFDAEDQNPNPNQDQDQEGGMGVGVGVGAAWNLDELRRLCESRRVELSHEFGFISFEQLSAL